MVLIEDVRGAGYLGDLRLENLVEALRPEADEEAIFGLDHTVEHRGNPKPVQNELQLPVALGEVAVSPVADEEVVAEGKADVLEEVSPGGAFMV